MKCEMVERPPWGYLEEGLEEGETGGQEAGKEAGGRIHWERMRPGPVGARGTEAGTEQRESRGRRDRWGWPDGYEELRERMVPRGLTQ